MNKAQLIEALAERTGGTRREATAALDALIEIIGKTLKKGDKVAVVDFGTFAVRKRAARQGRNPKTGAVIKIGAARVPVFKAGKALKHGIK